MQNLFDQDNYVQDMDGCTGGSCFVQCSGGCGAACFGCGGGCGGACRDNCIGFNSAQF